MTKASPTKKSTLKIPPTKTPPAKKAPTKTSKTSTAKKPAAKASSATKPPAKKATAPKSPARNGETPPAQSAHGAAGAFDDVVLAFAGDKRVQPPEEQGTGFGARALKVDGKIFAMTAHGGFTVKLPRDRVSALIASGEGTPFATGGGRVMKEWVTIVRGAWLDLAREARRFVGE